MPLQAPRTHMHITHTDIHTHTNVHIYTRTCRHTHTQERGAEFRYHGVTSSLSKSRSVVAVDITDKLLDYRHKEEFSLCILLSRSKQAYSFNLH